MAQEYLVYKLCPVCDGDGVVTQPSSTPPYPLEDIPCPECLRDNAKHSKAGGLFIGWLEKPNG